MKRVNFFFVGCLLATSMFFAGCESTNNPDNPSTSVPDPAGTMTANLAESVGITAEYAYIYWTKPDNFHLLSMSYYPSTGQYGCTISICDVGKIAGLGNITQISLSGFSASDVNISGIACETGHGYIIKLQDNFYGGPTIYVRLYVVEKIVSTSGGVMGAKVKYQFPFEP